MSKFLKKRCIHHGPSSSTYLGTCDYSEDVIAYEYPYGR